MIYPAVIKEHAGLWKKINQELPKFPQSIICAAANLRAYLIFGSSQQGFEDDILLDAPFHLFKDSETWLVSEFKSDFDMDAKACILNSIAVAIDWMVELVNYFTREPEQKWFEKCLLRIKHIAELEAMCAKFMDTAPGWNRARPFQGLQRVASDPCTVSVSGPLILSLSEASGSKDKSALISRASNAAGLSKDMTMKNQHELEWNSFRLFKVLAASKPDIEIDVWGYLIANFEAKLGEKFGNKAKTAGVSHKGIYVRDFFSKGQALSLIAELMPSILLLLEHCAKTIGHLVRFYLN